MLLQVIAGAMLVFSSGFGCLLAWYSWANKSTRGSRYFSILMLCMAAYALTVAFELASSSIAAKIFWSKVQYLSFPNAGPLWLLFALNYAQNPDAMRPNLIRALWIIPGLTALLVWTNEFHHLAWVSVSPLPGNPWGLVRYEHGPAVLCLAVYSYALMIVGSAYIINTAYRSAKLYRGQMAALVAGALLPLIGNILYVTRLTPIQGFDLAPFAFTVSGLCLVWGAFRTHLFQITPVVYDAVLSSMSEGVLIEDTSARVIDLNPAAAKLLGIERDVAGLPTASVLAPWNVIEDTPRGVKLLHSKPHYHPGQSPRCIEVSTTPLETSEGQPSGNLLLLRDLTERLREEEEHRRLQAHILHTQKLESLGVLTGGIAHDFNNILMAILGNVDLAKQEVRDDAPVCAFLRGIEKAARRASSLTKQMLAYSGKGQFIVMPIELDRLVRDVAGLLAPTIPKRIAIQLVSEGPVPLIEGDQFQIQQVLINLITNAAEAYEIDEAGAIAVATGSAECSTSYLAQTVSDVLVGYEDPLAAGLYAYLDVTDQGHGMDDETRRKMFEPFFTTKFLGRGLGMAAVLGIVRGHRGAIKIHSAPGQGTTVRVLFPAAPPHATEQDESATLISEPWSGSGTVLIVDDEEGIRVLVQRMLEKLGFTVLAASSGDEAIRLYREFSPRIDCVLLDLNMPGMSGETVFQELRRLDPDVRVILSSGYDQEETAERFAGQGLAGVIQKPYQLQTLRESMKAVLGR